MAEVTEQIIEELEGLRPAHLEAQIIEIIAERRGIAVGEALGLYYACPLSDAIEQNDFGLQFLDAAYLADEILRR